mmetsp:Transcript_36764/g.64733  ORF Transcript_36764/g.64733 Transcript_36764/m.64733 type:complete len:221 (+) Transcript_36764:85-747(+)
MSWLSASVDHFLGLYQKHCCCSPALRDDPQGKCGDVVVCTTWDTAEDFNRLGGYGNISDPLAVRQPGGEAASAAKKPGNSDLSSRASSPRGTWDGSEAASQEAFALRELMKRFVQEMIRGKEYLVVVENGQTSPSKLSLTPNLQYLQLEAAGVIHDIPLRNIKDICPGKLLENRFTPILLDDLCNTLVLRNNECVTFRLNSIQERDEFTKCIKVLSLALE